MGLIDEIGKNRENGEKEEIAEESATSVETEEAPTTSPEVSEEAIEDVSNEQVSEQVVAPKHSFLSEIVEDKSSKRETAAEVPLWYSVFLGIIGVIIAIDDEWIWIPGTIYGVCFWVYKRVKAMAYEVVSLPPAIMLSGLGSASIATVTSPTLAATLKPLLGSYGKGFRTLAKDMFLTPSGLVSPLTWALRFGWFTKLLHNKIDDTTPAENTFKHRLICMGTIAAFSETFARLATAPFAKLVDLKRKSPGASSAHVVRSMFKKDGLFGPWIGMAPLRVEVPHMAILLSTWGMSREYVSRHLPKVSDDDIGRKVLTRLPVDFACGAFAATVAYSITHSFRMSAEENRKHIYEVLVNPVGCSQFGCEFDCSHSPKLVLAR
eukprot:TRINITY_DN12127_c0_g1_i3.p1 TRINITY_DN12127_c0_g1~~TRINITY_DN12127_c0_g1_i3.p1  ORF type:complete len:378 (+),score=68.20 TRINITY_DN12127_c0_g1_i3:82-1215(+)